MLGFLKGLFGKMFSSFSGTTQSLGEMGKMDVFDMALNKMMDKAQSEGSGAGGGGQVVPALGPVAPMSNPYIDQLQQGAQSSQNDQEGWQEVLNFFLANQGGK